MQKIQADGIINSVIRKYVKTLQNIFHHPTVDPPSSGPIIILAPFLA